ncbi:hypothetical protein [Coleofasciculus sp. H7-2]
MLFLPYCASLGEMSDRSRCRCVFVSSATKAIRQRSDRTKEINRSDRA